VPDPYPCPTIASISDSFSPICAHACFYSQGCNQCKCMTWLNVTDHYSLHGNGCNLQMQIVIYIDLLWKFISNSYYFRKIYFLRVTSLHPKFYIPIFLWDVESSPNYTEKLFFAGIGTITLLVLVTVWLYLRNVQVCCWVSPVWSACVRSCFSITNGRLQKHQHYKGYTRDDEHITDSVVIYYWSL
jgi:hypothetical protein